MKSIQRQSNAGRSHFHGRGGISSAGAIAALGAVLVLILLGWNTWSELRGAQPLDPLEGPAEDTSPGDPQIGSPDPNALRIQGGIQSGVELPFKRMEKSFAGSGTLTGAVSFAPGMAVPTEWTLNIRPSIFALGRDSAQKRTRTLPGNITTFEEFDLPMGGYTIQALAPGMSSMAQEVMLYKLAEREDLPGVNRVHMTLQMVPKAKVEGVVYGHTGQGAGDLKITLQMHGRPTRHTVRTNYAGLWTLEDMDEGIYVLRLGPYERPLIPEQEVQVRRPITRTEDITLPPLYAVRLRAVDETDRPIEGASVHGMGPTPIVCVTGFDGQVEVQHLAPGDYQVRLEHKASGRKGRGEFTLKAQPEGHAAELILVRCLKGK
ncbi:MAG TPA: carboxypeptidase regulatory-like domain-containing protein [Planctomycetes bacterium]|nr:carboxypeptidase regulatory-like domain-containing protein [Planctomycetota bacterium]HIL36610.1 carboxypeptidase regulatory-like domain-containing protein [Planctomycetota bacterium]